jgi:hypothetical protein
MSSFKLLNTSKNETLASIMPSASLPVPKTFTFSVALHQGLSGGTSQVPIDYT